MEPYTCGPRLSEVLYALADIVRTCGVGVGLGKIVVAVLLS